MKQSLLPRLLVNHGNKQTTGRKIEPQAQPEPAGRRNIRFRWCLLAAFSLGYAAAMFLLGGASLQELYAPSPYHRLQADALLRGQLHIGDSIYQMGHDLAWHDGKVNHLWGLGVGMWLVPFEVLWRLFGQTWFPDRLALGAAFALLAWYSASTGWKFAERLRSPAAGLGYVWLLTLCPALWTLNQGPRLIYEETTLYACLVSLCILTALIRVAFFDQHRDFIICSFLSAASAIVRPTHGIYGLTAMLVCSTILLARRRHLKCVFLGNAIFIAGVVFLALTNWIRFGSPTEFGHRLSVTPRIIVFMTRIDNPMRDATSIEAAQELCGALFLQKRIYTGPTPAPRTNPWESPYARWRDPYLTTFDLIWAVICLAAVAVTTSWIVRKKRAGWTAFRFFRRGNGAFVVGTLAWSALSSVVLFCFYLYLPTLSARYLLDFAPAFAGFALLVWIPMLRSRPLISVIALLAWLGYEGITAEVHQPPAPLLTRDKISTELFPVKGRRIKDFGGAYRPSDPSETQIAYNGYGWHSEAGRASTIVILALDRPTHLELVVSKRQHDSAGASRPDVYRAMIDNKFLRLREIKPEGDIFRVRFDVPEMVRQRAGDEVLFLSFSKGFDKADSESQRFLYSVRWR
ncbi:MAG TPA: hypothetical protein VFZ59_06575 [Verrucomicrobiae bacterium]|nr:hypothetical protein [Verrucomicrobiae bacterium]